MTVVIVTASYFNLESILFEHWQLEIVKERERTDVRYYGLLTKQKSKINHRPKDSQLGVEQQKGLLPAFEEPGAPSLGPGLSDLGS